MAPLLFRADNDYVKTNNKTEMTRQGAMREGV
jgi:hypothetical protein